MLRDPHLSLAHTGTSAPITATTATLNGFATPHGAATLAWFEWGPDSGLNKITAPADVGSGSNVIHVSIPIADLVAHSVYRCRLVASNSAGVTYGADQRFTTGRRPVAWGDFADASVPVQPPPSLTNVVSIGAGGYHDIALSADGTVTIWGAWGGFGLGMQAFVPPGLTDVMAVVGGRDHTVALKTDGTVVAWGDNTAGQTDVPFGLTNVVAISAGDVHTMALKADGSVVAWGYFGINNGTPILVPPGLYNIVEISSGDTHCVALRDDGKVFYWSSSTLVSAPTTVTNVIAIDAAYQKTLMLKANGTVVSIGGSFPGGLSNVIDIVAGEFDSLVLLADGTLQRASGPQIPVGLTGVVDITGGDFSKLALADNTPPQVVPRTFNGPANQDWVVNLTSGKTPVIVDPNGDLITCRIVSLLTAGSLYQCEAGNRGAAITETNTIVTDPQNRVIFAAAMDESGLLYSSFSVAGNDGEWDSLPGLVTIGVVPTPALAFGGFDVNGRPLLSFSGLTNATYSVWASTNLVDWAKIGTASQPSPAQFLYTDTTVLPLRYYQVRFP